MSITPSPSLQAPPPDEGASSGCATGGKSAPLWAVIVLGAVSLAGLGGLFFYAQSLHGRLEQLSSRLQSTQSNLTAQGETLEKLGGRLEQGDARDTELQGQFAVARDRLGITQSELQKARQAAAELARQQNEQKESAEQLASRLGQLQQEQVATKGSVGNLSTDVAGVKSEVKTTKEELASTRSQLQRVVGDLGVQSDLIARNHGEIEELRQRGERDYIEFDLKKTGRPQRVASVQLELKKTDPKKQKYTLNLIVDDRSIEKKDKNALEPVQFYQQGFRSPTEIVVNQILKDRIVGYVSAPKKREERAPMKTSS